MIIDTIPFSREQVRAALEPARIESVADAIGYHTPDQFRWLECGHIITSTFHNLERGQAAAGCAACRHNPPAAHIPAPLRDVNAEHEAKLTHARERVAQLDREIRTRPDGIEDGRRRPVARLRSELRAARACLMALSGMQAMQIAPFIRVSVVTVQRYLSDNADNLL